VVVSPQAHLIEAESSGCRLSLPHVGYCHDAIVAEALSQVEIDLEMRAATAT